MKKLFLLASFVLLTHFVKAQGNIDAEVFIEFSDEGRYTVSIDDQALTSSRSRFRFFEVRPGNAAISVSSGNKQLINSTVAIAPARRSIFTFSKRLGLKLQAQIPLYNNGQYRLDDWDNSSVRSNQAPSFPRRRMPQPMDEQAFSALLKSVKSQGFDSDKKNVFTAAIRNNALTVSQLKDALKAFSFDDEKLKAALFAYDYVVDPGNFFQVRELFVFQSNKDKIDQFLQKQ
ncbi:DUF4476 domain-containing protein [Mucilaginibacter terrae]|nr:DUF4476 domain-containing protein [Mucilaginibacter terrae]